MYEEKVQGRCGRVGTRCAAIVERDEVSHREEDIIMHNAHKLLVLEGIHHSLRSSTYVPIPEISSFASTAIHETPSTSP